MSLEQSLGSESKKSNISIEVVEPQTHGTGAARYTDYLIKTKTSLPIFKSTEFSVRRRYSDFEWLKARIDQHLKIKTPQLPDKAWTRSIPFMKDALFEESFVEDRRKALNQFINTISEHPLVQTEKTWINFLQDEEFEKK